MKEGDKGERRNVDSFGFPYNKGQWHWWGACKEQRNGEREPNELQRRKMRKKVVLE